MMARVGRCHNGYATAQQHHVYLQGFKNTKVGKGHWNEQGHRLAGEMMSGYAR
jgi:hypothetical protein